MQKLLTRVAQANTLLCVGLDPTGSDEDVTRRLPQVIAETAPYAAAFKPNLAFFLSRGNGTQLLRQVVAAVPEGIPVILDGKFGDIANTAMHYAQFRLRRGGGRCRDGEPLHGRRCGAAFRSPRQVRVCLS